MFNRIKLLIFNSLSTASTKAKSLPKKNFCKCNTLQKFWVFKTKVVNQKQIIESSISSYFCRDTQLLTSFWVSLKSKMLSFFFGEYCLILHYVRGYS